MPGQKVAPRDEGKKVGKVAWNGGTTGGPEAQQVHHLAGTSLASNGLGGMMISNGLASNGPNNMKNGQARNGMMTSNGLASNGLNLSHGGKQKPGWPRPCLKWQTCSRDHPSMTQKHTGLT